MDRGTVISRLRGDGQGAVGLTLAPGVVRAVGALLALAVTVAHVADQGGVTAFTAPDWLGWGYRVIEVGGVLVAAATLWPSSGRVGWAAGVLLGVGPFIGYLTSRTVGVPGDPGDVGNWSDWLGTLALVVEAALITSSAGMILSPSPARRSFAAASGARSIEPPQRLSEVRSGR